MLAHYKALLLVAVAATAIILVDEIVESYFRQAVPPLAQIDLSKSKLREQFATLPIDHKNLAAGSYQNRYWVNDEFYAAGGPVFVHDVGEVDAEPAARRYLTWNSSYLREYLKEFHGVGIVWEHRYYGKSMPFVINRTTPYEHFRYLTLNQSLADLPYFAAKFTHSPLPRVDLTPASTPWIMVGCSYSGMRAAVSRSRYPETFYASYAASAPVQLQVQLNHFFDPVYDKLYDRGYGQCADDLHAAMRYLDGQLSASHTAARAKKQVFGPGAEFNSNGDFTLAVANIYSYFQSRGISGGAHSLASLCKYMDRDTELGQSTPRQGLAGRYGARAAFDRLISWPDLLTIVNTHFNTSCVGSSKSEASECDLGKPDDDATSASWTWQLCSELGLLTTQNAGSRSLVSRYLSLEYRISLCERSFPSAKANGFLPHVPAPDIINRVTGGRSMRPSNVFWTAGEYDPWRILTPLAAEDHRGQINPVVASQEIPACNVATDAYTVFGHVLKDAQHCLDYSAHSEQAIIARTRFAEALKQWLPCFKAPSSHDT